MSLIERLLPQTNVRDENKVPTSAALLREAATALEAAERALGKNYYDSQHGTACLICETIVPVAERGKPPHKPDCPLFLIRRDKP